MDGYKGLYMRIKSALWLTLNSKNNKFFELFVKMKGQHELIIHNNAWA